ncbi:protein CTLA-2-alpha-like [Diabrotica undecimpunctata]|uniref:protein CTLA-2-alpha-like n=1 Tax=Diabrotica undecimpunctata TaxID=50387 RepID=UPI003B634BDD
MLCKIFLFALFLAVVVAQVPDDDETAEEAWPKYKEKYNKSYDEAEDAMRFALFKERFYKIKAHNKRYEAGEVTWREGLNEFTDWTEEQRNQPGLLPIDDKVVV